MVYAQRRKMYRRKYPVRRGNAKWIAAGAKAGRMAHKAWSLAKRLKDVINIEYKYVEGNVQNTASDYNGLYAIMNTISQGTTDTTRIGDSLKVQRLVLRGHFDRNGQDAYVRLILLWDQDNKTSTASDILAYSGGSNAPMSPKIYDKRFQTKFLWDKEFKVNSSNPQAKFEMNLPINLHTQYDSASSTVVTGKLVLLAISNVVTTNVPTISYISRLTFTDN